MHYKITLQVNGENLTYKIISDIKFNSNLIFLADIELSIDKVNKNILKKLIDNNMDIYILCDKSNKVLKVEPYNDNSIFIGLK